MPTHEENSHDASDDGRADIHYDDGFNPGAGITPVNHTALPEKSAGDQLARPDRRLGSMAQQPQPLMNRRSTDPKTPPTAPVETHTVEETKGLGALLRCLLSKIRPRL